MNGYRESYSGIVGEAIIVLGKTAADDSRTTAVLTSLAEDLNFPFHGDARNALEAIRKRLASKPE